MCQFNGNEQYEQFSCSILVFLPFILPNPIPSYLILLNLPVHFPFDYYMYQENGIFYSFSLDGSHGEAAHFPKQNQVKIQGLVLMLLKTLVVHVENATFWNRSPAAFLSA